MTGQKAYIMCCKLLKQNALQKSARNSESTVCMCVCVCVCSPNSEPLFTATYNTLYKLSVLSSNHCDHGIGTHFHIDASFHLG